MNRLGAAILTLCGLLCAPPAFSQNGAAARYPVIGPTESLPLRVLAQLAPDPHSRNAVTTAMPCFSGGAVGNLTIVLNCDGNDSDGSSLYEGVPDTDLAVGDQYFVQTVDDVFTIYNKSDASIVEGPYPLTLPWTGFQGGSCSTPGSGDDFMVRYDKAAARWVLGLPIFGDSEGRYWLCLAVSTSSDPTGTYYLYAIREASPNIWDYPKLGIWTDAYYVGFNMFSPKPAYLGARACALDRTSMLLGQPAAAMQCFSKQRSTDSFMLPADIAGGTQPLSGQPEFFLDIAQASNGLHAALNLWSFHVDFTDSQNSTFTSTALTVNGFREGPVYVPEPGGALYSRSDRLMVPLAWRQTSDGIQHLVVNDAIAVKGVTTEQWFDITNPNATPVVAQQGTLVPDLHDNFWMGSANMDMNGNIALGFSNSGVKINPGIMLAGRLAADIPGTMETVGDVMAGTGAQSGSYAPWGDHSIMAVDPADDCTFWYSTEYYSAGNSGTDRWSTRVIEFKFTSCQ
ncbi:MAG TPA: hypothetical protein VJ999_07415 [Candidatus Sulfotelmatobacter sp.]|nr:hypothetical protein [Candidatus Sulfotelmatobacter sp.]